MIIKYGCVCLRPIEEKDAELLLYFMNAPEIEEKLGGWSLPLTMAQELEWIRGYRNNEKNIRLMIELSNGNTIGMISLTDIDWKNRVCAINYKVGGSIKERMKNDMHDAIIGILNYAFNELGLQTVTSTILEDNIFSLKLAKKMGFVREGVLRQRVFKAGQHKNQVEHSILREEFNSLFPMTNTEES